MSGNHWFWFKQKNPGIRIFLYYRSISTVELRFWIKTKVQVGWHEWIHHSTLRGLTGRGTLNLCINFRFNTFNETLETFLNLLKCEDMTRRLLYGAETGQMFSWDLLIRYWFQINFNFNVDLSRQLILKTDIILTLDLFRGTPTLYKMAT